MANDPNLDPREDNQPDTDPVEAELVAYLDNELDPAAARKVEAKLDADPRLRARADALKRSFNLLDFLPKPQSSPTFTTRTLDKLPLATPGAKTATVAPTLVTAAPAPTPFPFPQGNQSGTRNPTPPPRMRPWVFASGVVVAVGLAIGGGYFAAGLIRSHLAPSPGPYESVAGASSEADARMIENLPLYAISDDLDFLERLADADFFVDHHRPPDTTAARPVETGRLAGSQLDYVWKTFRELPPAQQDRIRLLDRQLFEQEPARRDRLFRVMELYAAWLYRLPDPERKAVLTAATADRRLEAIRDVRNAQWVENLPAEQRKQLNLQPVAERAALIAQWRAQEDLRRDSWHTARAHWESVRTGKPPWPFQDERMKKEVQEFATAAYYLNDPKRCRLSTADRDRLAEALKDAQEGGDKAHWFPLGKAVYDFSRKTQYELLPEPATGKPVVDFADLGGWEAAQKHFANRPALRAKAAPHAGKWPDFALEVLAEMNRPKLGGNLPTYHLGPCRPADFKDDVKRFIPELQKKLTTEQAAQLKKVEGKWPDYPRELARLARSHDMSVPGVMPPGPPSLWEKTYNFTPRPPAPKPTG